MTRLREYGKNHLQYAHNRMIKMTTPIHMALGCTIIDCNLRRSRLIRTRLVDGFWVAGAGNLRLLNGGGGGLPRAMLRLCTKDDCNNVTFGTRLKTLTHHIKIPSEYV